MIRRAADNEHASASATARASSIRGSDARVRSLSAGMGASGFGQPWVAVVGAGAEGWAEAIAVAMVGSWLHDGGWPRVITADLPATRLQATPSRQVASAAGVAKRH